MAYLFKVIRSGGHRPAGFIDIPFLGAKVAELTQWTLVRRGDKGPESGLYDLHAVLSFVSTALWEDQDYEKRILVNVNPTKQYRLQMSGMRTELTDRNLLIEGVTLCPVEQPVR